MSNNITVGFSAKDVSFTETVKKINKSTETIDDTVKKVSKSVGASFGSMVKAGAALAVGFGALKLAGNAIVGSLVDFSRAAIDMGGALQDMMTRTGAAGEGLVVMQRAFQNAGLAADMVPDALNKMQKALAGVNEDGDQTAGVFAKLGLSAEALTAMDPAKAFQSIATAISGIKDPATRTALAMELFGKSGGKALAVINDPNAFANATTQVGGLGKTLAENAGSLDKVGDSMSALQTKISQLSVGFTVGLLPALEDIATATDNADLSALGKDLGEIGGNSLAFLSDALGMLGKIVEYTPGVLAMTQLLKLLPNTPSKGTELPSDLSFDASGVLSQDKPQAPNVPVNMDPNGILKGTEAIIDKGEIAKQMQAERESMAQKIKNNQELMASRKEYMGLYNEESAILTAKLKEDDKAVKALERQRDIKEELNKMEKAGYNIQSEANIKAAAAIVDARTKLSIEKEITVEKNQQLTASQQMNADIAKAEGEQQLDSGSKIKKRFEEAMAEGDFAAARRQQRTLSGREQDRQMQDMFDKVTGAIPSKINTSVADMAKELNIDTKGMNRKETEQAVRDALEKNPEVNPPGGNGERGAPEPKGGDKAGGPNKLEGIVETIRDLVAKIEPKLPQMALGA
jgi:hypothetical protein